MKADPTIRDLIESSTKLAQRVTIERSATGADSNDRVVSKESLKVIMPHAVKWAELCRNILTDFLNKSWSRVILSNRGQHDWIDSTKRELMDAEDSEQAYIWMKPFNGSVGHEKTTIDERIDRFCEFISIGYNFEPTAQIHEFLVNKIRTDRKLFDLLIRPEARKTVFRLKNINHIVDPVREGSSSYQKLGDDLSGILSSTDFEDNLFNICKLCIILQIAILAQRTKVYEIDIMQTALDSYTQHFHSALADTSNVHRTRGLLKRIDSMKWGPKDFVRNEAVINEAFTMLENHGILTLTGVGAVGKTALANKMLLMSAQTEKFDRYITLSTKVNSDQKELDPESNSGKAETNMSNSLFFSLLNPKNRNIAGSINRLCRQIIQSVDLDWQYDDEPTTQLIESAIKVMKTTSMLVCIDNFEDIEKANPNLSPDLLSSVNKEYEYFQEFFRRWSTEYRGLIKTQNGKTPSQIIVTTRGRGDKQQNAPMPVPPLTEQENYQLFQNKVRSRLSDLKRNNRDGINLAIGQRRVEINNEFNNWSLPKIEGKFSEELGYKYQPAYTIFAAANINSVDGNRDGIFSSIRKFDPKGDDAEQIRRYVTSKIFGGLTDTELRLMARIMMKGMNFKFGIPEIRDFVEQDGDTWDFHQSNDFIRDFSQHRDFFVETEFSSNYMWNTFYFKEIKNHFFRQNPELIPEDAEEEVDLEETIQTEPIIKREERKLLQQWLSHGILTNNLGKNHTLNIILRELKKEQSMGEIDAAQSLVMLVGNESLGASAETINKLFSLSPPNYSLFSKFRRVISHQPSGSANKRGKDTVVMTAEGKIVKDNFHHIWEYLMIVRNEIVGILLRMGGHQLVLRFYNILQKQAENCFDQNLIDKNTLLEFYKSALHDFNRVRSSSHSFTELFEAISQNILQNYLRELDVLPKKIREDLKAPKNHQPHYKVILEFVDTNLRFNGRQEEILGLLFWLALRRVASFEDQSEYEENNASLLKLHEWFASGVDCVSKIYSKEMVQRKRDSVLSNFKQSIWSIEEISNVLMQNSGGMTGKLVFHKWGSRNKIKQSIVIPRGIDETSDDYLSDEIINELKQRRYPYRIGHVNDAFIYINPIIEDGKLIDAENFQQLREVKVSKDLMIAHLKSSQKALSKLVLWAEFKSEIPEKKFFHELDSKNENEQFSFYNSLIKESEVVLNAKNIQGSLYIKIGVIRSSEIEDAKSFSYSKKYSKDLVDVITKHKNNNGLSLPKDPKIVSNMFEVFYDRLVDAITFDEMKAGLKEVCKDEHLRYMFVLRMHNTLRLRNNRWLSSSIPSDGFADRKKTWQNFKGILKHYTSVVLIREYRNSPKLMELLYAYCNEVQRHF